MAENQQRITAHEGEKGTFRGVRANQGRFRDGGSKPVEFIAEMARGKDSPFVVLDLQEVEARQPHRLASVIQQVSAILAAHDRTAEAVVIGDGGFQRAQPRTDAVALTRNIRVDHVHQRLHTLVVLADHAARHLAADAETENEQRNQHHHPERDEEAGAEFHGARWTVPS